MKIILLMVFIAFSGGVAAQQMDVLMSTYYKDGRGASCIEDSAFEKIMIYATVEGRRVDIYQRGENKHFNLYTSSLYSDTSEIAKSSQRVRYYPNSQREEIRKYVNAQLLTATHYSPEGKIDAIASYKDGQIQEQKGWDAQGNSIKNFIYERGAEFPGGLKKWKKYLQKNLNADIAAVNGAPIGAYTVVVAFTVDSNGTVRDAVADNDPGFGTAQEAVRVIKNSPQWTSAVWLNHSGVVAYRQRQQLTFHVIGKNRDTTIVFLDSTNHQVDPSKAEYKSVAFKMNDSTNQTVLYSYPQLKKILESTVTYSPLSKKSIQILVKYDQTETKISEITMADRQLQRIIEFYPDGKKSSETTYGSIGLPIREVRWDSNGAVIP